MPACGIDPSIFVLVLTGLPAANYQATLKRLAAIRASQPKHLTVANFVIAEAYAVVQHHYHGPPSPRSPSRNLRDFSRRSLLVGASPLQRSCVSPSCSRFRGSE